MPPSPTTVSIIIPCHNAERFVAAAVESALAQDHPNVEVIVVDDGSTDGSLNALAPMRDRITLLSGHNQGACLARNTGLSLARGEFVKFLDADDVLDPTCVPRQVEALRRLRLSARQIIFGDHVPIDVDGRSLPRPARYDAIDAGRCVPLAWLLSCSPMTASPLYPASAVRDVGGFDPAVRRGQEYNLNIRLALAGYDFYYHPTIAYYRREHSGARISTSAHQHFTASADNLRWLWRELCAQRRDAPGDDVKRTMAEMGWHAGVDALHRGGSPSECWAFAAGFGRSDDKRPLPPAIRALVEALGPRIAARLLLAARHAKSMLPERLARTASRRFWSRPRTAQ